MQFNAEWWSNIIGMWGALALFAFAIGTLMFLGYLSGLKFKGESPYGKAAADLIIFLSGPTWVRVLGLAALLFVVAVDIRNHRPPALVRATMDCSQPNTGDGKGGNNAHALSMVINIVFFNEVGSDVVAKSYELQIQKAFSDSFGWLVPSQQDDWADAQRRNRSLEIPYREERNYQINVGATLTNQVTFPSEVGVRVNFFTNRPWSGTVSCNKVTAQ